MLGLKEGVAKKDEGRGLKGTLGSGNGQSGQL